MFVDGDALTTIDAFDGRAEQLVYLGYSTDALAYALTERPEVLVLGAAGGRAVLQAIAHGAAHIDAVELNPDMVRLVREDFAGFAGGIYDRPDVTVHVAEARRFLAASTRAWDVIRLPDLGASGAAAGGRGLSESYLYTVEAFELYHGHLEPGGWLSVTGAVDLPPRSALKLVATALGALERRGVGSPADSLILMRGLTTFTLLMKRGAVGDGDIAAVKSFAQSRSFDLDHYPGMPRAEANQVNVQAAPELFDGVAALAGRDRDAFISRYKFDIAPATDDRPYFHNFFRWRTLPELVALRSLGGAAMLEWGELVVAATLVQAVALSALLILLPLWLGAGLRKPGGVTWRIGGYFFALGLAFLFVEIAFIQKFTLYLGHPIYAVSVVLTGFLGFAGLGAGASAGLDRRLRAVSAIDVAVLGIAAVALTYLVALPAIFAALAHLSDAATRGARADADRAARLLHGHAVSARPHPRRPARSGVGALGLGTERLRLGGQRRRRHAAGDALGVLGDRRDRRRALRPGRAGVPGAGRRRDQPGSRPPVILPSRSMGSGNTMVETLSLAMSFSALK